VAALKTSLVALISAASLVVAAGCSSSPAEPSPSTAEFVLDVVGERFTIRTSDQETIALAEANRQGQNRHFPIGSLRPGNGGFNAPWTWHLDPSSVRFVEAAIEVCDGRPSFVESHQSDYATYCPWAARVVARR